MVKKKLHYQVVINEKNDKLLLSKISFHKKFLIWFLFKVFI